MAIRWTQSGYRRSSTRRYTQATPPFPGGEWATDRVSLIYDQVVAWAHAERGESERTIRSDARMRVDTGWMRASTTVRNTFGGSSVTVEMGWFGNPFYAFFQEFGTIYVDPMEVLPPAKDAALERLTRAISI